MGLNTIMGHLDESKAELCFRSLRNLKNQKVTLPEFARECNKRGWHCMRIHDRVYIAKSELTWNKFGSQHEEGSYVELQVATTVAAPRNEHTDCLLSRLPPTQKPHSELALPSADVIGEVDLKTLSQLSREAVACSHCFANDREQQWGHVPGRPADRPDDVAFAPWIGQRYASTRPRVAVMLLNPGHSAAQHKRIRRDLGHQLRDGVIRYEDYISHLTPLVGEWGRGAVVEWLRAIGLEFERIAFLNMALCAVADDAYFDQLFDTCFRRHTRGLLACLKPDVVVLSGKKELEPYGASIESMGLNVVLTWHYRPMRTNRGKRELERVRTELKRLGC